MSAAKTKLENYIGEHLERRRTDRQIVRKLFLFDHPAALQAPHDECFDIFDSIAEYFKIPLGEVKVIGSAQTGYSYYKGTDFAPSSSDLDVAIISPLLFRTYWEIAFRATDGYTDQTKFRSPNDMRQFQHWMLRGMFRPDLMPFCKEKVDWRRYFNQLSSKHQTQFKNINAGIYQSEVFFESKQKSLLTEFRRSAR